MRVVAILPPIDVIGKTVTIARCTDQANADLVRDRHVQHGFQFGHIIVTDAAADIAFKLIRRFGRSKQDRATSSVAAEQSTLRARQNLHALKVDEVTRTTLIRQRVAGWQRHFVHVDDNCGRSLKRRRLTANGRRHDIARCLTIGSNHQRWHRCLHVLKACDATLPQSFT